MKPVTDLEEWLVRATRGLCEDAVQRIRAEISDHYSSILTSGHTPEYALQSLGDPKAANRHNRRVYLTRKEAVAAGALANPRKSLKKAIIQDLFYLVLMGWLASQGDFSPQDLLGMLLCATLFWLRTPLVVFYPPYTKERCYNHLRIFIGRTLCGVLLVAYYEGPTVGLMWLGIWVPLVMLSDEYRRWNVVRKLPHSPEGIPVVPEVPAPHLTDCESRALQSLRRLRACDYVGFNIVWLGVALYAFLSPLVGGTLLVALSFAYLVPRFVSIKTPDRGRRFRRIKWCLFALTAVVPPCYVIFGNLEPDPRRVEILAGAYAYLILLAHVFREPVLFQLRKKLPVDQWPERLHQ